MYWLTHNEHHSKFKTLGQMKSHDIDNIPGPFLLFFSSRLFWLAPQGYLLQKVLHSCQSSLPVFRLLNTKLFTSVNAPCIPNQHQTILLGTSQHDCGHSTILRSCHFLCFPLGCREVPHSNAVPGQDYRYLDSPGRALQAAWRHAQLPPPPVCHLNFTQCIASLDINFTHRTGSVDIHFAPCTVLVAGTAYGECRHQNSSGDNSGRGVLPQRSQRQYSITEHDCLEALQKPICPQMCNSRTGNRPCTAQHKRSVDL